MRSHPSRSGLRQLGDGYQGILVSDCYCAYDSLPWAKAKCLGHMLHEMSGLLAEKKGPARILGSEYQWNRKCS